MGLADDIKQKAIDLGCDFVEIDIRKTKDGRFVSIHNVIG